MATEHLRFGRPVQVLLAAASPQLLQSMSHILSGVPGLRVAAQFSDAADLLEWLVWTHQPWHYAFVDMALWSGPAQEWLRQVVARRDAGTVVALVDAASAAQREACARAGIGDLLPKGDADGFRDFVQKRMM